MTWTRWAFLSVALGLGWVCPPAAAQTPPPAISWRDVVLVLDVSGSMRQSDSRSLVPDAILAFTRQLDARDAFGLVVFGGQARELARLAPLGGEEARREVQARIAQIRYAEPRTNIAAGIERGLYALRQDGRPDALPVLVFITDGIMDTGSAARDAEMREWLRTRLLPDAKERGVRIFGIALTEQADFALIQEMAAATRGDYYRALRVEEMGAIFGRVRGRIDAMLREASPTPKASVPAVPALPPQAPRESARRIVTWSVIAGGAAVLALLVAVAALLTHWRRGATSPKAESGRGAPPGDHALGRAYLWDAGAERSLMLVNPLTRIGRAPANDLVIPEPQVSAHHAEIEHRRGHYYLRDLRSTNGTWVNQRRVSGEVLLKSGDTIRFDQFQYAFFDPERKAGGTLRRQAGGDTIIRDSVRPSKAEATPAATQVLSTVGDGADSPRCPMHPTLDATERCERCGQRWCALCNPPMPGTRICRRCREAGRSHRHETEIGTTPTV